MKIFLLDLWHDLREKRLWPIAAVLALALVAVPVVLSKPAEDAPSVAPATASQDAPDGDELAGLASVKLAESAPGSGSTLGTFDPSDPFRPPESVVKRSRSESNGGQASQAGASDGGSSSKGGDTASGGSPGSGDDGGGVTVGGTPDSGDTGGDGETTTTRYQYVVDVTFTGGTRSRRIKGLQRLEMLPNDSSPLLIFMGATAEGNDAVFLVDSTLDAAGEGRCKPSAEDCALVYMGAGSEHQFTNDDGDSYTLRVDEIRRVKVGATPARSRGSRKTASASVGASRRFVPPLIADLVSVSSTDEDSSNPNDDRR